MNVESSSANTGVVNKFLLRQIDPSDQTKLRKQFSFLFFEVLPPLQVAAKDACLALKHLEDAGDPEAKNLLKLTNEREEVAVRMDKVCGQLFKQFDDNQHSFRWVMLLRKSRRPSKQDVLEALTPVGASQAETLRVRLETLFDVLSLNVWKGMVSVPITDDEKALLEQVKLLR